MLLPVCVAAFSACAARGATDGGRPVPAGGDEAAEAPATPKPGEAGGAVPPDAGARPRAAPPPPLPEIPLVSGPVAIHVQYPRSSGRIAVRDSNFLFGTVGTGRAQLLVNDTPVRVEPNGAFLAWLPVPAPARGDTAVYVLVARSGTEVDSLRHRVRLPPEPFEGPAGSVWVDSASLPAAVERWLTPEAPLEFAVRAAPGVTVRVEVEGESVTLHEEAAGLYRGAVRLGATLGSSGPGRLDTLDVRVVASAGAARAVVRRRYPIAVLDPDALPVLELREAPDPANGTSGVVPGRPTPEGPYRWLFPAGTRARADRRVGDRVRLRLTSELEAWVVTEDAPVVQLPGPPDARVDRVAVERRSARVTAVRIPLSVPVPTLLEEPSERTLRLTLYGALGETERMAYGESGELEGPAVEYLEWAQRPGGIYELTVRTRRPVWGYRLYYARGSEGAHELILEIRAPPAIDPDRPLLGRRIAVDAGHPPAGAFGPTGYYEGNANLAVARRLVAHLRAAGAEPVLIRRDTLPMGLYDRTNAAIRENADLFVSIHNNALPDGVRPFGEEGTTTFYYQPHSRRLAAAVQTGMLRTMGLPNLGIQWGNLAVVRMSWMPSVLAEGAFMMMPRHEAALRLAEFQEAYARGVLAGIEGFLREHGSWPDEPRPSTPGEEGSR